jgi:ABC-type branched-subunit amino acid transport system ATPase component
MENKETLRIENLVKKFGNFVAVNRVNLSIVGDKLTSIIGPNGAGKTTLINVISGMLKPDAGRIFFMGKDITGLQPHKIVRMGISRTFQVINLFGELTVYQNILIASLTRGENRDYVEDILRKFHLEEYRDFKVYKLSHGLQRLVEIAIALATKPKLLLLDEPIAGLNPEEKDLVVRLIKDLEKQVSIVMVEHDMDVVFNISENIIVMNKGEIIAHGTPSEIIDNKYVKEIYLGV